MADVAGLATGLGVANTFTVWNSFTPSLSDVRKGSASDSALVADLRHGEFASALFGAGVAGIATLAVGSVLPLLISTALLAALITLYEYTLHHKPFAAPHERTAS